MDTLSIVDCVCPIAHVEHSQQEMLSQDVVLQWVVVNVVPAGIYSLGAVQLDGFLPRLRLGGEGCY